MTAQAVLPSDPERSDSTRARLLSCARLLFARFGIDGVSVRDIVAAAGARNAASIHYYFGSKEALIEELVVGGAKRIDGYRNELLDAAEAEAQAGGRAVPLRRVAEILVESSFAASPASPEDQRGYLRFVMVLQLTHRQLFIDALQNRWNSGYMRCMAHFRRALAPLPSPLVEQRLRLLALYLGATLASREGALEGEESARHRLWGAAFDVAHLVDTVCGLLECAPARATMARLVPTDVAISPRSSEASASARRLAAPRLRPRKRKGP